MGFDEVRSDVKMESAKMADFLFLRWNSLPAVEILITLIGSTVYLCVGVHDKLAEADWPQRTYAEGTAWAGDCL